MREPEPVLVMLIICASLTLILWKYFDGKHKIRNAILEKGLNASEYQEFFKKQSSSMSPLRSLQIGMLAFFVGIGAFIGAWLHQFYRFEGGLFFSLMLLSGGLGLIIFYFIASKKLKESK